MPQFLKEVLEQPQVLKHLLHAGRAHIEAAAAAIRQFNPQWALIAARGSSDNAARYGQYLLGAHNRLSVGLALPSLITLYGAAPSMKQALVIGISQSGQSPDVVSVLKAAQQQGSLTLGITNDLASPLAQASTHCIPLLAGEETAVAATKTYTAQLLTLAMLSAALEANAERWAALANIPQWVQMAIDHTQELHALAESLCRAERWLIIGRGFNYSTAFELALKIKETSYAAAEAYSTADLLHGPIAMLDQEFPALLISPSGIGSVDMPNIATLCQARGAPVLVISDRVGQGGKTHTLGLPTGIPEWLSPLVAVVPGQLWACALAKAKGRDPDRPRGLSKVTRTH